MDTVFNKNVVDHMKAPMYLGDAMGLARYETVKHPVIDKLTEKQLSFFWRPEEIDLSKDLIDYNRLTANEQYIFTQNLKYQSLLDSVQGRAPNLTFLPLVSDVALETWITTWSFSETIHSRSYTHIMRNIFPNPSEVFDKIMLDDKIMRRAESVTKYYDDLIRESKAYDMLVSSPMFPSGLAVQQMTKVKEALYLAKHAVNALEAIRFYVSFACTFSFGERGIMEGNAKIMKLIARDEQLHLKGTQYQIRAWQNGEDDPEMVDIAKRLESKAAQIFLDAAEQEKEWATDLLTKASIPSMSLKSMLDYIDYLTASRMRSVNLPVPEEINVTKHPLPWIRKWLNSETVQVAAQEAELSSYLVGQVDPTLDEEFFEELEV